ncbi:hypothetical protein KUCAC02_006044 [Chaenocephalus aceratus]|uniref:Uncharacterized protein n=1 Tax=Chaenocephalus aceratus TaxID=36190 RepID=A0ACB9WQN8_CHAAC|nr:hypothetical protein KUCAC02_006044 [Chaenocephalus aceratus]
MASNELANKLQSRMAATQETEPRPEPEHSPVRPKPQEADGACGDSSSELSAILTRRQDINEGNAAPRLTRVFNPYTEFKEFSRKQIKDMEMMFKRYDTGKDGFIDLMELKLMMEKLGAPQTHLGLKNMIKEVDEDFDGKLSFREFLLIFRRAAAGELQEESGSDGGPKTSLKPRCRLCLWAASLRRRFGRKKEERKRQEEDKKERQAAFKQLQSTFCS